jgi:hypothetical protein
MEKLRGLGGIPPKIPNAGVSIFNNLGHIRRNITILLDGGNSMSWLAVGDWADEMSERVHRQRLIVASKHFNENLADVLGSEKREHELLARYEATGLSWPPLEIEDDEEE